MFDLAVSDITRAILDPLLIDFFELLETGSYDMVVRRGGSKANVL
jgi:hypothetical protein